MSQKFALEAQWPPRSSHEVLSTPGGHGRLRRPEDRPSPSPSPVKRSTTTLSRQTQDQQNQKPRTVLGNPKDSIDDDDDDEETLQLQLQEIQARLRLKKLQKAKAKESVDLDAEKVIAHSRHDLLTRANSAAEESRSHRDVSEMQERGIEKPKPEASIHVPVSPIRRVQSTDIPRSPGRVLLGIDKGLKGRDVSLRRAPSLRKASEDSVDTKRAGRYMQRTNSQASSYGSVSVKQSQSSTEETKPRTFSERMADIRSQEVDRVEKDALLKRIRSKAFNINEKEMEEYKVAAAALPEVAMPALHFSRDQVIDACNNPSSGLQRSKSTSNLPSTMISDSRTTSTSSTSSTLRPFRLQKQTPSGKMLQEPSEFESFSSLHLSKRIIPHTVLTRTLAGKKTYNVPDLLKVVVSPFYRLPDIEEDIVVLAIIASKSEPKQHKAKIGNEERGKYMVMTLTDLKWELDLFLFNSGFDRFWKLTPGTVIAILNPSVMPPTQAHSGRFSLTLNSSDDTVLEIGSARDLGFCKSVKKDGKTCDSWIDKRHTEYCEFHVNELLKKTIAGRMEVNTMNFGKRGGTGNLGGRQCNSRDITGYEKPKKNAPRYDVGTHSKVFIGTSIRSSADLLDADVDPDAFHRGINKEERMRRQLAAAEKEREIARKLSSIGGGLGADYLRMRDQPPASSKTVDKPPDPPDAAALGLLGGKAEGVNLSPIKRKRGGMSSQSSNTGLGWGGDLTKTLGRMKEGEPVRKKTRFVTAKGIREAGRESFGGDVTLPAPADNVDDDDEDDLDIIR